MRVKGSFNVGLATVSGEVDREREGPPAERVFSRLVHPTLSFPPAARVKPNETTTVSVSSPSKSIYVAGTKQRVEKKTNDRIMCVWGSEILVHEEAIIFGPLQEEAHARVKGLRVKSGEDVGVKVRDSLYGISSLPAHERDATGSS